MNILTTWRRVRTRRGTARRAAASTCSSSIARRNRRRGGGASASLLAALGVALSLGAWALWRSRDDGRLRVWLLDVGQGECIVARWRGRTILVDGGSSDRDNIARSSILPFLQMSGVRRIDAVFVSHPDDDHFNALPDVAREVPISRLLLSPAALASTRALDDRWGRFVRGCRARGIPTQSVQAPWVLAMSPADGSSAAPLPIRVLWPGARASGGTNTNSLVLKIELGASSVLLTGDADAQAEAALALDPLAVGVTVLKVAHHGSKFSSTPAFLSHARPRAAVISCGRYNSFGHPSGAALDRLAQAGAAVKRTDLDGTIEIECSESSCQVSSFH